MHTVSRLICFFFFLFLFPELVILQENVIKPVHKVPRVENLKFDGKLDEPFWADLQSLPFIQYQPTFSETTSEKSSVYLVYDQDYFYLTGRLYASKPEYIRQQSFKRDAESASVDYFGIVVDSYNDKENGLAFFTSPTGFRYDASISGDAAFRNSISTSWNTFWDALTSVTDKYYDVEIRIPWSSMKFENKGSTVTMGVAIWRYLAALNEMNLFPSIDPSLGEMANWRPSKFHEIEFENIQSSNPVYITPYLLLGNQRENYLNDDESAFVDTSKVNYNVGLDVKYNLTSNLTLDLTVNTDFAQVESDDERINLTRYQLFRPEKRQFFQERSDLFDFRFNHVNHLFHSRNIGIEDGEAVPILGGLRLTGKVGDVDVGFINMQTAKAGSRFIDGFSGGNISNNFSVLRFKKKVINQYSYIGAMLTNKMDFKGDYSTSYGLDGIFKLWGDDYLTLKWAQTFEDSLEINPFSLDAGRFLIGIEKRRFSGFNYDFHIGSTGKDYNPEMGFMSRNNYLFSKAELKYGHIYNEESYWRNISLWAGYWADLNYEIEAIDQASVFSGLKFQTKNAWAYKVAWRHNYDQLLEALTLSDDVEVPIGKYHYSEVALEASTPYNKRFGLEVETELGRFFDGSKYSIEFDPKWNPNAHLEMHASYEFNYINFNERNEVLKSHILRFRALYMLNAKFSVSAFMQYNNASHLFLSNLKIRYNPREGNDLYLVVNEVLNGSRDRMIPNYPLLNTEVLALKYTYTFKVD